MDIEKAMETGSPTVHTGAPDNIGWELTFAPDSPQAVKEAEGVVKERILQQRLFPIAIECRGVGGEYDNYDQRLTLSSTIQRPPFLRLFVRAPCGLAESS